MKHDKSIVIAHASQFYEAGHRVFALHEVRGDRCGCDRKSCDQAGKHPIASSWQNTPLWSEEQFETICEYQLTTGYGVVCRDLLVIDVDARNGGIKSIERLIKQIPEIAGAGLIVETGSGQGSKHYYFSLSEPVALIQSHKSFPGIEFKSSGYVVGPGSLHKSGRPYSIAIGEPSDIDQAPRALIELLRKPERHRSEYDGRTIDVSHADLVGMLEHINPDCGYETWIRIGMAIHDATQGTGFDVWDAWSAKGDKYEGDKGLQSHWHSFGRSSNPVRIGTLIHYAEEAGWKMPVTFSPDQSFDWHEPKERDGIDTSSVDLKRPPGFVGELAAWIESQSRRPRENLAVAGALVAMGNVGGLRYTDDLDGVTTNLFAFCVAGSRTGKEAIQQGVTAIHRAAGIAAATHGAIKSEQEITRNLIRHQAALYVIDEIGIFLQKIKNAQKKGGASYLDGVIGMLMQAYSKASGFMLLTGDTKEDIRADLQKILSAIVRKIEENELSAHIGEHKRRQIEDALSNIDKGLEKPFLSLIGFTTPVTFNELVDFETATNGFIGRALLFNERETAPRSKRNFQKAPMSDAMAMTLMQLYTAGHAGDENDRVECYADRIAIPTSSNAKDVLDRALDYFEDQAEAHKARSGLESLFLGAYEIVSKVSLILAVPEGRRTSEHVRWAFALVKRDIEEKSRLVVANDADKTDPRKISADVMNLIAGDGETLGVIKNRLRRKYDAKDIEKTLEALTGKGLCERWEVPLGKGRKTTKFKEVT